MSERQTSNQVARARDFATRAHDGQFDKAGKPYILHPMRVAADVAAEYGDDHPAVIVAFLHDVVEDTPTTIEDIDRFFGDEIAQAVEALSKRPGECLADYYERVRANPVALIVKTADIRDNSSPARLAVLNASVAQRLRAKYQKAREKLGIT